MIKFPQRAIFVFGVLGVSGKHFFIAGPCVIESEGLVREIAFKLKEISERYGVEIIFKASFDKANRTSVNSFRGPGIEKGLGILSRVKEDTGLRLTTDIHLPSQAKKAAEIVDIVQIPAFLCRQTDMLIEAGRTGRVVNIKKGQFMAPWDMRFAVEKVKTTGNDRVWLTERGTTFGYNNLVVDFRSLRIMKPYAEAVVYDVTHSMQLPGGAKGASGGTREYASWLAFAAASVGVDGLFFEVHPEPEKALSDASVMLDLNSFEKMIPTLLEHWQLADSYEENS